MKKLFGLLLLFQFYHAQATWTIVEIINESDLQLNQAVRTNRQNYDVEIQSISKKIKKAQDRTTIELGQQDGFGTVGKCKILAQTPQGENVSILFLADPTNRIASGRVVNADSYTRSVAHANNKGMMARVMLEQNGIKKMIGSYCGYEQENQSFKLILQGSAGNYHAQLIPVN